MEIGLIIFDCDGVLVDSEPLAIEVLRETIAALGVKIDAATAFREFLGQSLATVSASLTASHGIALDAAALERMHARLYAVYRRKLKPMAGVLDALDKISLPVCIASSSAPERIRFSLELTGLSARFGPALFSAAMVERGKPAPDLFLHAAAAMGVPPGACLVIEDSPAGIVAARAAGMRVFAFVGGSHIGPAGLRGTIEGLRPTVIFDDMHALPGLVEEERSKTGAR